MDAVSAVVEEWMVTCVTTVAATAWGRCPEDLAITARDAARTGAATVVAELSALLATDVDDQRDTPLGVLRRGVRVPTEVLAAAGVPPRRRDGFATDAFPEDVFGLVPATWSEVHPSLHEPGIIWGAWKAKTVLDRRRSEGRR